MSNIISELVLKTGGFNAGMKNAEKGLQSMKGTITGLKGVLMTAFAAITTGATAMKIREQFDIGRQLNALSTATGTSVKDLAVLQKAFGMSGVEADRVAPMIGRMRKVIASAAGGGAGRDTFGKLHLDIKKLGNLNATEQMKTIGDAIMQIKNPTERTAASMAIFGRQGQDMLKVFASGAINDAAENVGQKAKILDQNSALFANISKTLEKVSAKTGVIWAEMAASIGPAIKPVLDSLAKIDLSGIGKSIGDAVAFLITAFSSGEVGNIVGGVLVMAFQEASNFLLSNLLGVFYAVAQYFKEIAPTFIMWFEVLTTADFWKGMGNALLGMGQSFIAFMLEGVAKILDLLAYVPGLNDKMTNAANAVRGSAASWNASAKQSKERSADQLAGPTAKIMERYGEAAKNIGAAFQKGKDIAPKFDTDSTANAWWESVDKVKGMVAQNQASADKFNAENRPENAGGAIADMETETKQKLGPIFAGSMMKIGGGGTSVGGGKDPLLEENRRQTGYLSQIASSLKSAKLNVIPSNLDNGATFA